LGRSNQRRLPSALCSTWLSFCFVVLLTGCCQRPMPKPRDGEAKKPDRPVTQIDQQPRLPSFISLFKEASPAVVNISAAHPLPIPKELLPKKDREILKALVRSLGSGFVFDDQGHVATCSSVVQDADEIEVILISGRRLKATLVGSDEISDIAVLSIPVQGAPRPLALGDSSSLKAGDWVASFGYPFGLSHTITAGIVSAIRSSDVMQASHGLILSDASINPGCNGGPLVNTRGEVVGINMIPGQTQGGMGLAIPIDDVKSLLELLKTGKSPGHPWLGVSVQYVDERLAESFGLPNTEGALVSMVVSNSPADKAGLKRGDIIITLSGRSIEDPLALIETARKAPIGRQIKIQIIRKGKPKNLKITPCPAP